MTITKLDLAEIARRRSNARAAMNERTRANVRAECFDCPCVTPWMPREERCDLGLRAVSSFVCAVATCVVCDGTGQRHSRAAASLRMRQRVRDDARHADPRFPRPTHTTQLLASWDGARRSLDLLDDHVGLLTLLLGADGAIAEVDRRWRADIDALAAERRRTA
jgi:hypothetical protein